jgi:hypothetical protein
MGRSKRKKVEGWCRGEYVPLIYRDIEYFQACLIGQCEARTYKRTGDNEKGQGELIPNEQKDLK